MVACLDKSEGNADFHEIVDFLTASSVHYALTQIHATIDGKTVVISESSVRSDLHFNDKDGRVTLLFASMLAPPVVEGEGSGQPSEPQPAPLLTSVHIPNIADEAVFKEWDDRVVKATTTAASLDVAQASGGCKSEVVKKFTISLEQYCFNHEERLEQDDLMDFVPPTPYDSPLSGGHTPRSDEGRPNINELMAICTNLSNRVLAFEKSKTAQDLVIQKLKKKVKRLENKQRARNPGMKLFKIGTSKRKSLDKEYVSK
ncbi:hypothetical protein Tco_0675411 [Tanacetum coccineum]